MKSGEVRYITEEAIWKESIRKPMQIGALKQIKVTAQTGTDNHAAIIEKDILGMDFIHFKSKEELLEFAQWILDTFGEKE